MTLPRAEEFHYILVPELPKELKSRRAFQEYQQKRAWKTPKPAYPCEYCCGQGWTYNPHDPIDPVEGSKHRQHLSCPACGGSGDEGPTKFWLRYKKAYNTKLTEIAHAKKILALQERLVNSIITRHYTDADMKLMGFHNPRGAYRERTQLKKRKAQW